MNHIKFIGKVIGLISAAMLSACGGLSEEDELALTASIEKTQAEATPTSAVSQILTDSINLALNKEATQSSLAYDGNAAYAVDGNTDGTYQNASVTHTETEEQPWWQVDLGSIEYISHINIFNRTDSCCTSRLSDFYVLVSNAPINSTDLNENLNQDNITSYYFGPAVDGSIVLNIELAGRYVRVQLVSPDESLNLAEVEVMSEMEITSIESNNE